MVYSLSQSLSDKDQLTKLVLDGLKLESRLLRKHISEAQGRNTDAAYNLLDVWLQKQDNRRVVHTRICQAIKDVDMKFLIEEAKLI